MLAANLIAFARILRRIGLPVGPGKVALALEALNAIDISHKEDVYAALHAVLVERHSHRELFAQAFACFWRAPRSEQAGLDAGPKLELAGEPTHPNSAASAKPSREARARRSLSRRPTFRPAGPPPNSSAPGISRP